MSTAEAPSNPPVIPPDQEITVISHSMLFYWWPVWVIGYAMFFATLIDNHVMAVVPEGTTAQTNVKVMVDGQEEEREAYVLPKGKHVARMTPTDSESLPVDPRIHMASNKYFGVIFCTVLLLVIVITNVPLRGMWSVVVIITILLVAVIFALAGWWEYIFSKLVLLDIRINMGGYLFISTILLIIWLVAVTVFDRQIYIVFQPGQFKVCTEIGGGEKVYDTIGLTLERQKADLFRHLVLGWGSGDLIVKTTGAQAHQFDLPNVLSVDSKVRRIEALLRRSQTEVNRP